MTWHLSRKHIILLYSVEVCAYTKPNRGDNVMSHTCDVDLNIRITCHCFYNNIYRMHIYFYNNKYVIHYTLKYVCIVHLWWIVFNLIMFKDTLIYQCTCILFLEQKYSYVFILCRTVKNIYFILYSYSQKNKSSTYILNTYTFKQFKPAITIYCSNGKEIIVCINMLQLLWYLICHKLLWS